MADFNEHNIDIKDWNIFIDNNTEIKTLVSDCSVDISNIIINNNKISSKVPEIDSALSGLKTVSVSSKTLLFSNKDNIDTYTNKINEYLVDRSVKLISCINFAELAIDNYNGITAEARETFNKIMNGLYEYDVLWLVASTCPALAFVVGYSSDLFEGNGSYLIGDGTMELFDSLTSVVTEQDRKMWATVGVGSSVVLIYSSLYNMGNEYLKDQHLNTTDWKRVLANSSSDSILFAMWSTIAGSIGGPVGVIVAAEMTIPVSKLFSGIKDGLTGDAVVDEFDENGKHYVVTANGEGAVDGYQGNYHTILKQMKDNENLEVEGLVVANKYEMNKFNKLLNRVRVNSNSVEEAKEMFESEINNNTELSNTYYELNKNYNFNVEDWYNSN